MMPRPLNRLRLATLLFLWCSSSAAHAILMDRGGGLLYDEVLDVTWISDADYARTSGYSETGNLNWYEAMEFVEQLVYFDPLRGQYWDDWRLPFIEGEDRFSICIFANCKETELGHLFVVTGTSAFTNVSGFVTNWTSGESPRKHPQIGRDDNLTWIFNSHTKRYQEGGKSPGNTPNIWILRDGDVGAPISEPSTKSILHPMLTLLWVARRRLTSR